MAAPDERRPRSDAGRRPTSFSTTLLVWSLVLALIPMILMAAQGYHCARQAVTEAVSSDLQHLAGARASQLAEWLRARRAEVDFLVRTVTLPPGCRSECVCEGLPQPVQKALDLLERFQRRLSGSIGFAVLSPDGSVLGTQGQLPGDWRDTVTAILPAPRSTPAKANLAQKLSEDSSYLALTALLQAPGRPPSGYLVAYLDVAGSLSRILAHPIGPGQESSAYLTNEQPDDSGTGPRDLLKNTATGSGIWRDREGEEVVGGFARIPELNTHLVVEVKSSEALRWLEILARRALVVGLVTALFVLLFSRFVARRLSDPLKTLADVARRISSGDHLARVPAMTGLELEEVGRAHNNMLDVLQQSRQRLAQSAALAAVGELSTSIVHELRNPLSSVKMNLQALCRRMKTDPILGELTQIARQQAERIEHMLGDLLDYGKPLTCLPRKVPVSEILSYAAGSVSGALQERGIALKVSSPEPAPVLETDPERLAQALENLLRNAIEASPSGAEIRLDVAVVDGTSGQVAFDVADQGPGLPKNARDRLFQPFFSNKAGGTGLGLANVKKIVELLGGTVHAEDGPEGGARFRIMLPGSATRWSSS